MPEYKDMIPKIAANNPKNGNMKKERFKKIIYISE